MRDKRLAVLASRDEAVHDALKLRGWTDDVILLTNGPSELDAERLRLLRSAKVSVDERPVVELVGEDGELMEIVFADRGRLARDGLLVAAPLHQRSGLAGKFGVDALHRTNVPNVFAAGDICTRQPHVAGAVDLGSKAAMIIVQSLLAEDVGLPYPPVAAR
jgi:thioredoxin reductase